MTDLKVYEAIAAVTAQMSKEGISKERRNQQQGYQFRGIDDVYNALSPMLAQHKLCILPRIISRDLIERQTSKGGALFYVTVEAEFDFVSAEDGSKHTVRTFGEAMDSADKATNKAMSAAYKYAAMQTFCIPTEGDNDADAHTYDVAPSNTREERNAAQQPSLSKSDARPIYAALEKSMRENKNTADLAAWWRDSECQAERAKLPEDWRKNLHGAFVEYGTDLKNKEKRSADYDSFPGDTNHREVA